MFAHLANVTAFTAWLENWKFDKFFTLATNKSVAPAIMRDRLREWDGRMNRKIVGREWSERIEDRMFSFYFLEKPVTNSHWHGLVRFFGDDGLRAKQQLIFDDQIEKLWRKLVPTGTVEVRQVYDQAGANEYVAKELYHELQYTQMVTPDELERG